MPNPACRRALNDLVPALPLTGCNSNVPPLDSPGLALQRYLSGRRTSQEERENRPDPVRTLLERVQASPASEVYKAAFQRYKEALPTEVQIPLTLGGPMAVGLGMSSPIEVGLTTLHTYGMPYIPGSAIKGVCRDVAEELNKLPENHEGYITDEQLRCLFGDQKNAGRCVFYDAWYIPEGDCKPFHRDVVTVHHPDYYQQKNNAWPTDFDDPNPVPFIVVKPGARFLFAIKPSSSEWADFVKNMLVHAMTTHGVGGKTNAGYGWFDTSHSSTNAPKQGVGSAPQGSETVWEPCDVVKKRDKRNGFTVTVKHDEDRLTLSQGEWNKLTAKWDNNLRNAVLQDNKKVRATIHDANGKRTVVALEPEG